MTSGALELTQNLQNVSDSFSGLENVGQGLGGEITLGVTTPQYKGVLSRSPSLSSIASSVSTKSLPASLTADESSERVRKNTF